jgi:hypothetical protein
VSPLPGDWGTVATSGFAAKVIRWATRSDVNHAFLLYDYDGTGQSRILEMGPDGLQVNDSHYGYTKIWWSTWPLTKDERALIGERMDACLAQGMTYNWIADLYIGLGRFNIHMPRWVWKLHARISPRQYQCAQLVDYIYLTAGVHLFTDGRTPGQVSPGDLRKLDQ